MNKILRLFALLLACAALFSAPASGRTVILSSVNGGPWLDAPAVYPLKGQDAALKVEKVPGASIKWRRIIPDACRIYNNANFPWALEPYKWKGFDKIDYKSLELGEFDNQWEIRPFEKGGAPGPAGECSYQHDTVGSFWFQAVVEKDGASSASPGLESSNHLGLSPDVMRVSIREEEGFPGYLTSFFNVPGVFGSTPPQSYNYIGADCADILLAALHRFNQIPLKRDYNVAMVVEEFPVKAKTAISGGVPEKRLRWDADIRKGDFIAVRYSGGGQFAHIGALYKDADKNGLLGAGDLVIHAGPHPLDVSRLESGAFDGEVVILKPQLR